RHLGEQFATKLFRFRSQPAAPIVTESHPPIANLLSKNPIFLHEIFDDILLMLVHPSSDRDHNKRKWIQSRAHRRILPSSRNTHQPAHNNHFNEFGFLNTMRYRRATSTCRLPSSSAPRI